MLEIKSLEQNTLDDVIRLYNRAVAQNPYAGSLDRTVWATVMETKLYYDPGDVLIAYENGVPSGYVHLCQGPNTERTAPDPALGSIEALFFDPSQPQTGRVLIEEAVHQHQARGAHKVLGWSSFSGYPLYRGIFIGLEPMAWEGDEHVLQAFRESDFVRCQHSVIMALGAESPVTERPPSVEADFHRDVWTTDKAWEAATWQGLEPYQGKVTVDHEEVGTCLYAMMPIISAKYGHPVGCIGGLGTKENWRRKGIGAFLVAKAVNHMVELGARRITVGTQHDNWAAHATYRRLGFEIENATYAFERLLDDVPA